MGNPTMKLSWTIAFVLKSASAMQCKTCEERNWNDCVSNGQPVTCPLGPDESPYKTWVCYVEESQGLGNKVNYVVAGCKQHEAAYADWDNNDNPNSFPQCESTEKRKISKCRQFCTGISVPTHGFLVPFPVPLCP